MNVPMRQGVSCGSIIAVIGRTVANATRASSDCSSRRNAPATAAGSPFVCTYIIVNGGIAVGRCAIGRYMNGSGSRVTSP